jgi:hypothetical protein
MSRSEIAITSKGEEHKYSTVDFDKKMRTFLP